MIDINGKKIVIGQTVKDKWGTVGFIACYHNRINWITKEGNYWICQAIVDLWKLEIVKEEI